MKRTCLTLVLLSTLISPLTICAQEVTRRVNVPYFDEISWSEAAIFWFGRLDPPDGTLGRNYADVRVAYTAEELVLFVNIVDYYLWYNRDDPQAGDLTDYDAVAVYLDTAHDRATAPQADDYTFVSGLCLYGCDDRTLYRQEGRGNGSNWDMGWTASWTDGTWASWEGSPAYNNNYNTFDYGWWSYLHIPWSAVGLSGPPSEGTVWGLGLTLYDRDDRPPAGAVTPQTWPEELEATCPATWGEIRFGRPTFSPSPALQEGTTVIRRGLGTGTVEDAWVGGGGTCSGGHKGDPDQDNYGDDGNLFVANQSLIADFPCFSKSFLKFDLGAIPAGKVIISATLTLHHWGNASPDEAQPSLIWLLTVDDNWQEGTLTWNNAPLVRQNLTATWINPLPAFPGWPGIRYDWDATQAVAEAYAAGRPLSVALYTADTNPHSSKYLKASETGDWNALARPTLTVVWGRALATINKRVSPIAPTRGDTITYTLTLLGNGQPLTLTDPLPAQTSPPLSITATEGTPTHDSLRHRLTWHGTPDTGKAVTITFPVTVLVNGPLAVLNTSSLTAADGFTSSAATTFIVDAFQVYLPLIARRR